MIFFFTFLIIFLGRMNSSIFGYEFLNTDEFVIGAKAMRLIDGLSPTKFDGATSGILNAFFLTWPRLFNLDISYISIRISAILAISLMIYFTYKIVSRNLDKAMSILVLTPLILFFSLTKDPDFLHYTNELISILLIVGALNFYFQDFDSKDSSLLIISSILLGFVIFAKMQFYPIACLIIAFINFKLLFFEKKYFKVLQSSIAFFFPVIFFSIYYYLDNELKDLFYNVLHFPFSDFLSRNQITEKDLEVGVNSLKNIVSSSKKTVFIDHLLFNSVFHLFYLYFIFFIFLLTKIYKKSWSSIFNSFKEFKVLMLVSVIIFTNFIIIITGSVHRHYLINLIPIIPIFLSYYMNFNKKKIFSNNFSHNSFLIILTILFIMSLLFENNKFFSNNFVQKSIFNSELSFKSPEIFRYFKLKTNQDKAIVWGWKPEIYLLSGLTPSNREATNLKQIDNRAGKKYYRERFIKEFDQDNPSILVDYTKRGAIFYNKEKFGIDSFKELKKRLDSYIKINSINNNCPDFYLRKDKYKNLQKSLIEYSFQNKNTDKLKKLNDFNIDEQMCDTEVLFSDISEEPLEKLKLQLKTVNDLDEIMLLASSKNNKEVVLNFHLFENKILKKSGNFKLKKKPHWTVIKFNENIKINNIFIDIENLTTDKFGLDEIKIFKK